MNSAPLSKTLDHLLSQIPEGGKVTVNGILAKTDGRGIYLIFIWLSLPFVVPVSVPGFSVIVGVILGFLAISMCFGRVQRLPGFLGDRALPLNRKSKVYRGSMSFLKWLERWVKPRKSEWIHWPAFRMTNLLLLGLMASFLVAPIPGVLPFTNSFPSYTIILIAAGMMEEDGITVCIGYVMALLTMAYFSLLAGGAISLLRANYEEIASWLRQWL